MTSIIKKKYIELINKEIDGVNTPEESKKLKAYLAESKEAHNYYNEMISVSETLSKSEEIEPEPELKAGILNLIKYDKHTVRERKNLLEFLFSGFEIKLQYKYTLFFTGGLIAGIALLFILNGDPNSNISNFRSTIFFKKADHIQFSRDDITYEVDIKYSKKTIIVELVVNSAREIEIVFYYDKTDVSFNSFKQQKNIDNKLTISEDELRLNSYGENRYIIQFNNKTTNDTPIRIKLLASGALIDERTIETGKR